MTELREPSAPSRARAVPHRARVLSSRRWFAPVAIGLFGFLLSEIGNWIPSVWYDETATITSATRSWAQLVDEVQHVDAVHAAYYAFMHLVFDLVGYSPFTLRLPSAIAVGLTAAGVVLLARLFDRPRLAVIAGILFCLLPRTTWTGGEGRSYAMSALFAVLLSLVLVVASRSPRKRWWIAYSALVVLSCVVFVYLALIVLGQAIAVIVASRRGSTPTRVGRRWLFAVVAAGVILLPFALLVKSEKSQVSWIDPLTIETVRQVYETQWFWGTAVLPALGWILLCVGAWLLLRGRSGDRMLAALTLPAVIVPTAALILVSELYVPVYSPRYVALSVPFVAIVMAVAIDALRKRWAVALVFAVIVACIVPHLVLAQRIPTAKQDSTWSQVASLVGSQRAKLPDGTRTAILYGTVGSHSLATARVVAYAYPREFEGTVDPTLVTPAAETGELWEKRMPVALALSSPPDRMDGARTAFLITGTVHDRTAATTAELADHGWRVTGTWTLGEMRVTEYVKG